MKISVIHPSRGRPQQAFETAKKWFRDNIDQGGTEYILSLDKDDYTYHYSSLFKELTGTWFGELKVIVNNNTSAIEAINNAAKTATGELFIIISDDFDCPQHWDTLLLNELSGKSDFLVKTQDGLQPVLITMPIMDRIYYNRFGYIYNTGYSHMYADQELTAVGHMLGRVISSNLLFPHNHYTTGKTAEDHINKKNDATYPQGLAHFSERLKSNFGISQPVINYHQILWR